jgi:hypothetical protein
VKIGSPKMILGIPKIEKGSPFRALRLLRILRILRTLSLSSPKMRIRLLEIKSGKEERIGRYICAHLPSIFYALRPVLLINRKRIPIFVSIFNLKKKEYL